MRFTKNWKCSKVANASHTRYHFHPCHDTTVEVLSTSYTRTEETLNPWIHEVVIMIAPTLAILAGALFAQIKRKEYYQNLHVTMNSRLDELLRATRLQSFAEGKLEGAQEVRVEIANGGSKKKKPS